MQKLTQKLIQKLMSEVVKYDREAHATAHGNSGSEARKAHIGMLM